MFMLTEHVWDTDLLGAGCGSSASPVLRGACLGDWAGLLAKTPIMDFIQASC